VFPIHYRDFASMLSDRGVAVNHTTLFRQVLAYAQTLGRRIRKHLRPCNRSWRVDEPYIKVRGIWTYLIGAVDSLARRSTFCFSPVGTRWQRSASSARHRESRT